ncbi:MAG: nucleotidyltransferase domain-containing protein [Labilithrix sp.]|nr:nucleotidyltransferase domain-containing protein [Labilithrix sp.]
MLPPSLRDAVRAAVAATPGLELALVFGSAARGEEGPASDLDVAVLGDLDRFELAGRLSLATGREVERSMASSRRARSRRSRAPSDCETSWRTGTPGSIRGACTRPSRPASPTSTRSRGRSRRG